MTNIFKNASPYTSVVGATCCLLMIITGLSSIRRLKEWSWSNRRTSLLPCASGREKSGTNLWPTPLRKAGAASRNLSLIPGEVGAAAVQNIGAYGVEIKDVIVEVEAYNQLTFEKRVFSNAECLYGYRDSYFKNPHNDPHIVTHVTFRLSKQPRFVLQYGNLEKELAGCEELTPLAVRKAVIDIRPPQTA